MTRERRIVFIVGLHRSGTTLLTQVLGNHPETSGFSDTDAPMGEGQYLQTVMQGRHANVGSVALKPRNRLTEASALASPENAEKLWQEWAPYWDLSKPVLLEKSPGHILKTRLLQYYFPKSRFLIITRHPVAQAMAIRKWANNRMPLQFALNWSLAHETLLRDLSGIRHKFLLRYEDLCRSSQETLGEALEFAGLSATQDLLDRELVNSNDRYFAQWQSWSQSLSGRTQSTAARSLLGRTAAKLGYRYPDTTEETCPARDTLAS